jgi:hypothetical protein
VDPSSRLAVEVFVDIMEDILPYMGVFPEEIETEILDGEEAIE